MTLSTAQLKMRRSGITATDLSAVLGENPWHKPIDVWMDKMGYTQLQKQTGEQAAMGHAFESAVAQFYKKTCCPEGKHWRIYAPNFSVRHPTVSWAIATPDRYVFEADKTEPIINAQHGGAVAGQAHHLLEVKLVGPRALDKWLLRDDDSDVEVEADRIPSYVYCQTQWQMFVTGYDRCDVAAQLGGTSFRKFEVLRDEEFLSHAVQEAGRFWTYNVLGKKQPEPDGSASYKRFLDKTYPRDNKLIELVEAPPEAEALAAQYKEYCDRKAAADKEREFFSQKLKALIGDRPGFQAPWGKATWTTGNGKVDYATLIHDLDVPKETIDKYRATQRTLRVTLKKG